MDKQKWLKDVKAKYPKKRDDPDDPNNIDYYEIEAQVKMLKEKQRKDQG